MLSPQVLLVGILAILGVSMIDAIRCLLVLARGRSGIGVAERDGEQDRPVGGWRGLPGWTRPRWLILGLYVVLQPAKAASGGTV